MFYLYSNGFLVSSSRDFSEVLDDFFDVAENCCLNLSIVRDVILNSCVHDLIRYSGYWYRSGSVELGILTDMESYKWHKSAIEISER